MKTRTSRQPLRSSLIARIFLGPYLDLSRFITGALAQPPPSRRMAAAEVEHARSILRSAGCDLRQCSEANLHTARISLPATRVYDLCLDWQTWPCSAFFACPRTQANGERWFSYRFYGLLPIVEMRLQLAAPGACIIYRIEAGIGRGGYHAFLIEPVSDSESALSIFTTFPPSPLFIAGLHDQMNADIYRQFHEVSR